MNPYAAHWFKHLARQLWRDLGKRHKYGLDRKEVGITDDLIYQLVRYARSRPLAGIQVWQSKNEAKHGHDIDLFIEANDRTGYYWFPLQAKVLQQSKRYESLYHHNRNGEQWDLLRALRSKVERPGGFFCQPYYLLYNGFSGRCRRDYFRQHWPGPKTAAAAWRRSLGCSLAEVDLIHRLAARSKKKPGAGSKAVLYHQVHDHRHLAISATVFPWHHLFRRGPLLADAHAGLRLLTIAELNHRLTFYKSLVEPPSPLVSSPTSYYYYYSYEGQEADDFTGNQGRYALVINSFASLT